MTYLRRSTPLHAARSSAAIAWCAALVLAAFTTSNPLVVATLAIVVLIAGAAASVGRRVTRSLLLSLPMAVAIVVINALVAREGLTVVARLGNGGPFGQLDITAEALAFGGEFALVLIVVMEVAVLASAAIDPDEVLRSMRRVSFRSALTATVATRMVPLLALDSRRIGDAQRCRPKPGGRLAIVRAVTANALDRSLDVAATLEVRGYGGAQRPRRLARALSRHDIAFFCSAALLAALSLAWPASFSYYPTIEAGSAVHAIVLAGALALAALLPFTQRRGIER
ncbi:MAG TPA: energy-coupling factor transporter transmembrane component T [Solirubrobacteraceae bacterium]|jgi:energy-coupling factor transport system permease protein|nr:energy-coupling factor transporter transmembrane component T [Solirubrobacteraceae bacterium]